MKRWMILAAGLAISGCAMDETIEPPAELVEFEQQADFDRVWSIATGRIWAAPIGGNRTTALRLGLVPATDGERVYVASHDGNVQAFRLADGKRAWQHKTKDVQWWGKSSGVRFSAGPVVGHGYLVIASLDGNVVALNAETGELAWSQELKGEVLAPPLVMADQVILRTTDGRVVALATDSGARRWETLREVPALTIRGAASPATDRQRIFAGFDNGKVAALSRGDGGMIWEATIAIPGGTSELAGIVDVDGDLTQYGNELYATSYSGHLAALAVESGEVLWRRELSSVLAPDVSQGDVFVTDIDSVVRAFDRLSGTTLWTQDGLRARYLTAPSVFGDLVVHGDFEGYLHFLDIGSGEMRARLSHTGKPIRARPVVAGDRLIVLSEDGRLAVYRRTDIE